MHEHQEQHRRPVDEPRVDLGEPVVDRGHHDHRRGAQRERGGLLLHEREPVQAQRAERLVRGRVHEEEPRHRERDRDEEQHGVQVAEGAALRGEGPTGHEVHRRSAPQSVTPPETKPEDGSPYNPSMMLRTIGAAVVEPWPPCSTRTTITYRGSSAGTIAANQE